MPVDAIKLNTIIVYITEKLVGLAKVYKKLEQIYPVHSNRGSSRWSKSVAQAVI